MNNLNLDFSKLNSIPLQEAQKDFTEPLEGEGTKTPAQERKAQEQAQREREEALRREQELLKQQREEEDHQKTQELYNVYQLNIRRSRQLRADIMKGVHAGEPPQRLLLKAVECISSMTGDKLFYNQIEKDLEAIQGEALKQEIPLEMELEEVQDRLTRLKEAMEEDRLDTDARRRGERAIREHEGKQRELEKLLEKAN